MYWWIQMSKTIAFIVVGWHNKNLLAECFDSILAQTYKDIKIVYVDNGSTDDSVKFVQQDYPDIVCLDTGKNNGFAKGNNIGIKTALNDESVEYVALLNSDATLARDWVEKLVAFSKGKKNVAAMQGVTLDYYNHDIIDSTHLYVARNSQATQGSCRERFIGVPSSFTTFGVNCAAAMFTRQFIEAQPYKRFFDETMFMYLEDVDVALRSINMGYKNYCVKDALAYHMGSASSKKNKNFPLYMTFRNNTGLLIKNMPLGLLLRLLPKLIRSDSLLKKELKRKGRITEAHAVRKGRLVGLLYTPYYVIKRSKMIGRKKIHKSYLWNLMNKGY
jgi:GT2 family glycosyltransferase